MDTDSGQGSVWAQADYAWKKANTAEERIAELEARIKKLEEYVLPNPDRIPARPIK